MTHKKLIYISIFAFCSFFFLSCDRSGFLTGPSTNSTSNGGSITFKLELKDNSNGSSDLRLASSFDCTTTGIDTVQANLTFGTSSIVASGGPWPCSAHSGSISTSYGTGTNIYVIILGKDSGGNIKYTGEKYITITSATTDVGTITLSSFTPILSSPANNSSFSGIGGDTPYFQWTGSSSSNISYQWQVSTSNTFSTLVADRKYTTDTIGYPIQLSGKTTYYWRVKATDNYGNESAWSDVWTFTFT